MRVLFVLLAFGIHASILLSQEEKPFSYKDDKALFERVIKLEEALVHMQQTLDTNAEQRDKRFEDLKWQVDNRFEDLKWQVDSRFEDLKWYMDRRFSVIYWIMGILSVILTSIISGMFFMIRHNMKAIAENGKNIVENGHYIKDFLMKNKREDEIKSPSLESKNVDNEWGDTMQTAKTRS